MKLYEALTYYRKQNKITFDELVLRTGIPKSTLQKVFTGVTVDPGFELVRKIASGLGVTVDDISAVEQERELLSPAALAIARKYDALDEHSKKVVEAVVDLESRRDYAYEVARFNALSDDDQQLDPIIVSTSSKKLG